MLHDILVNGWVILAVQTLIISFASRFVLDLATSPFIHEERPGLVWNVMLGWSLAVVFAGYAFGNGLGVVAALVACAIHITNVLHQREVISA